MEVGPSGAAVRIGRETLPLPNAGAAWTGATSVAKLLKTGDLVTVTAVAAKDGRLTLSLDQDPREQGAVVVLENASGAVRAMVGGYDWTQSKFNRSTQALRQAGSAFKPFVFLTALEQGYTAADTVFDGPLSIVIDPRQPPYRPNNYDGKFHGIVTLRRALEHSYNVPTVRIGQMVGLSNVIETAHRLGVRQKLQAYPSMPLGAFEVTLLELTAAYSVFANQGLAFSPYLIERITDANGDLLEQTHPDAREVETPQNAFQLLQMLKGVTQRGTAGSAARLKLNIAGKTGTTNDFTDAWFIGVHSAVHDRRLGGQRPEDADDRQGGRRSEGRAADLDPDRREDEGRRPDRPAGGLRGAAEHRPHARRLRDGAQGHGRHAAAGPRGVRQRDAADRGVERPRPGDREAALVAPAALLRAEEGRAAGVLHAGPAHRDPSVERLRFDRQSEPFEGESPHATSPLSSVGPGAGR